MTIGEPGRDAGGAGPALGRGVGTSSKRSKSRLKAAAILLGVAAAAWMSQASVALTGEGPSDRLAFVPLSARALGISLLAGALAAAAARAGLPLVPLGLLALTVLPWLPADVPPAFLLWSGPLALLLWVGLATAAAASFWRRMQWRIRYPAAVAGAAAVVAFSASAWSVAPRLPGGDEPHYLVITQSLLYDGDLKIEDNHRRGDYRAYYAGDLRPDFLRRSVAGEIYSIHAPGLPAIVAPAFALAGHHGVMIFLVLLSALGSALAWQLAWLQTGRRDAAWFGWAVVTLGVTTVFHSFSVYPDGPGGVIVLTGVWALLRAGASSRPAGEDRASADRVLPWLLHGAGLALLPWLHSRFALLAGALGVLILIRLQARPRRIRTSLAFLLVPAVSCAAWLGYFFLIYGSASPSAPYGGEIGAARYIADGLAGLFFDQRFGLLPYAPVLVFAFAGFAVMRNRLALELLLVVVPYLLLVTNFRMWWGGWSAPARFAVPVLLLMALPAAHAWCAIRRPGTRATALGALLLTVLTTIAIVFVDDGRLAYNVRTEPSLWAGWLGRNADLAAALPAWSDRHAELFRDVAIWCAALVAAWAIARQLDRVPALRPRALLATATAALFALAAMGAATVAWQTKSHDGTAALPAQLQLLRRASTESRAVVIGVTPPRAIPRQALPGHMRLDVELLQAPPAAPGDQTPLFAMYAVPAGQYRLRPLVSRGRGTLTIGVGRDELAIATAELGSFDPIVVQLPVDVRALLVRGDEDARRHVRGMVIEPLSLVAPAARLTTTFATSAVAYGRDTLFFLDDRSFPEPDAFWVGGSRESSVVHMAAAPRSVATLFIRNAPVDNRLRIQSGQWQDELRLAPSEERRIDVPVDNRRGASIIRFSVDSGFRPSAVDPSSRDHRYLGVWVQVQ
jgi:hypothetical protein